ncbi:MSHA biogenesis protein MshP [Shewanella sp. Isolate11]|uniref:MSHA biogenesis protein MshP n=1 Tax=Shewanella sp. Isolate11 TaxID=2908530 RepID=UPI001EFD5585|nr:MSHA biogenesis protein MshP [Shewanella sp. Isolate11]MCG9695488.1 MSHA biogenesis protein MshP [Shewanella sp. Isolate11]
MFLKFDQAQPRRLRHQRGSALVVGVFIITVMFLMAAALVNILRDADEQVNLEVLGTRAFAAANSGAEVALARLFPLSGLAADSVCLASSSWTPPDIVGFRGCSVNLTCSSTTFAGETLYAISSEATCGAANCDGDSCIRVNRKVEVQARD